MRYININGRLIPEDRAQIGINNSAFRSGYGLFETMLVQNGQLPLAPYHWQRLFEGLTLLRFDAGHLSPAFFEDEVHRTVNKNQLENRCRVRLQVYSSIVGGKIRGTAEFMIECFEIDSRLLDFNQEGLHIGIAAGICKSPDRFSHLKTLSALHYAAASAQAAAAGWNDACLTNHSGNIIETSIANIFWVKEDRVFTPPLTEGCVRGVMRQYLLSTLPGKGYDITEQQLTVSTLEDADEVFLTNAIRRIKWVETFNDARYSCRQTKQICTLMF